MKTSSSQEESLRSCEAREGRHEDAAGGPADAAGTREAPGFRTVGSATATAASRFKQERGGPAGVELAPASLTDARRMEATGSRVIPARGRTKPKRGSEAEGGRVRDSGARKAIGARGRREESRSASDEG